MCRSSLTTKARMHLWLLLSVVALTAASAHWKPNIDPDSRSYWFSLVCAIIVVGFSLILGHLICKFSPNLPSREIQARNIVRVKNPFRLKLKSVDDTRFTTGTGAIGFVLSATTPWSVKFFWEVKKTVLDAALFEESTQQTHAFDDVQDDTSDRDSEDAPSMHVIPLEHILQGSYKDCSASQFYEAGSDIELFAVPPSDLEYEPPVNSTGSTSSLKYALVVTVESMRDDECGPQQLSDIVAHIAVIKLSRSAAGKRTGSIVMHCVQTSEGKIYRIKKLFVEENDDITETQTSPSSQWTSTQRANAECLVCREQPVTIAVLPCRHTCMCTLCVQELMDCPLCRGPIRSYFKLQDDDFISTEHKGPVIIFVSEWEACSVF